MAESGNFQAVSLDALAAAFPWLSLHTAAPGTTGAAEIPGVVRKLVSWAATTPPTKVGGTVAVAIPTPVTVTHWSVWSAASGGSFGQGGALPSPIVFATAGTYNITPILTFPATP